MGVALQSFYAEWLSSSSTSDNGVDCPTRRYIVRVRDSASSKARSLRYDPSATSAVVGGLRPGSVLLVRLVVETKCRHGRRKGSRWVTVHLPAATVSTPGRITKSVRDLQARDTAFQRTTVSDSCIVLCTVFYHI